MMTVANRRKPFQFALDLHSGVPAYRQIIDQVMGSIATGALAGGDHAGNGLASRAKAVERAAAENEEFRLE